MSPVIELWSYRSLIANLAQRELKSKYKRSVLGWLWSLLNPGLTLLIYTIVFGSFIRIPPPVGGNGELNSFALYLFAALVSGTSSTRSWSGRWRRSWAPGRCSRRCTSPPPARRSPTPSRP